MTTERYLTHTKNLLAMMKKQLILMRNNDDIQTNVYKNNCNEETVTNLDNSKTVLQVNVDNKEIT